MRLTIGILACLLLTHPSLMMAGAEIKKASINDPLHLDWLDTTISPNDDFYTYANGMWQKNNPVPAEYSSWGNFQILNEKVQQMIHQMLIKASENKQARPGSIEQKVGDFYFSGMDEKSINQLGIKPIQAEFDRIEHIKNLDDLLKEVVHLHQMGVDVCFGLTSMQDFKNSQQMVGALVQGGLGLPDRDYYLKEDVKFKKIRDAYVKHVANLLELLGDSPQQAAKNAKAVMSIETQLAQVSMSQIEQRDPYAVYHMMGITQLDKMTPHFLWSKYLAGMGLKKLEKINYAMPKFFQALNKLLVSVSIADWKTYFRWHLIDSFDFYLSKPFVDEGFNMAQALTGVEKLLPRWKRVVQTENAALGFAIGKMYVDRYFSQESKGEVLNILKNIRKTLRQDIATLKWMTPATRQAALNKLDRMEERIGYPEKWWDYSSLRVDRGPYVLNVIRANQFLVKRDLKKIGKPVDRSEWAMTPQTINAYYDPSMNNLNMPAGILQPPFFDPKAPIAMNYGAIGFVMGHEMTHGFDDQGAQFDANGNLNNWWTPGDLAQFKEATKCIVNQYSQYVVDGNLPIQGELVVGEATADLGGITLAYRAFRQSDDYKRAKIIEGFTPDQQFFLGAAHIWANNIRPEQIRNQVTVDPHPPAKYRVNGSFANTPEFQAAYKILDNSPMVNKKRCVIW